MRIYKYKRHALEVNMPLPTVPILFMFVFFPLGHYHINVIIVNRKPATALADPYPAPTIIPKSVVADSSADYESELVVIIGKTCKDISEVDAFDYVLGYTAGNDVSSRKSQLEQSQWCFSKGFDGACPLGPVLVSPKLIPQPSKLHIKGYRNGNIVQDSGVE